MTDVSVNDAPRAVLARFYAAEADYVMGGGHRAGLSFDDVAATLHPETILHETPDLPWGGDWHGHQGWMDFFDQLIDAFDVLDVNSPKYFENGDDVVVSAELITRSRAHGTTMTHPLIQIVTVENGVITRFRPFYWNVPDYVKASGR